MSKWDLFGSVIALMSGVSVESGLLLVQVSCLQALFKSPTVYHDSIYRLSPCMCCWWTQHKSSALWGLLLLWPWQRPWRKKGSHLRSHHRHKKNRNPYPDVTSLCSQTHWPALIGHFRFSFISFFLQHTEAVMTHTHTLPPVNCCSCRSGSTQLLVHWLLAMCYPQPGAVWKLYFRVVALERFIRTQLFRGGCPGSDVVEVAGINGGSRATSIGGRSGLHVNTSSNGEYKKVRKVR